ncbi:MAG: DUF1854 domain-containing protein [Candidatus Brocadiae bacterium]|nr:DUF1854 domain-containing protein [Candidatus Brocadiia bacterium]
MAGADRQNEGDRDPLQTFNLLETLTMLDPASLELEQTVADGLVLRCPGVGQTTDVSVRPCFPVTEPEKFLVFRDAEGQEIGMLEDLEALPRRFRRPLRVELNKQHFVPVITGIDAIFREFQIPIWQVQTDRGPRRLELRSAHDAHRLPDGRIYVRDAEGNGYLIPDYRKLDRTSQGLIELYV